MKLNRSSSVTAATSGAGNPVAGAGAGRCSGTSASVLLDSAVLSQAVVAAVVVVVIGRNLVWEGHVGVGVLVSPTPPLGCC